MAGPGWLELSQASPGCFGRLVFGRTGWDVLDPIGLGWTWLDWAALHWAWLGWTALGWAVMGWSGFIRLDRAGLGWLAVGREWSVLLFG